MRTKNCPHLIYAFLWDKRFYTRCLTQASHHELGTQSHFVDESCQQESLNELPKFTTLSDSLNTVL